MNDASGSKSDVKEFLFKDFEHLGTSLWENEKAGETRANWFIGIFTGVVGGLVTLSKDVKWEGNGESWLNQPRGFVVMLLIAQSCLFVYGVLTYLRFRTRHHSAQKYKRGLRQVREIFKKHYGEGILEGYDPFPKEGSRKFGGLDHFVLVLDVVLGLGIVTTVSVMAYGRMGAGGAVGTWAVVLSVLLAVALCWYWQEGDDEAASKKVTHGGGIVYKEEGRKVEYLLVGPKEEKEKEEWLFPKGHIEEGETAREAAVREVCEETGVFGRIRGYVGDSEFVDKRGKVRVEFYLMKEAGTLVESETRRREWFSFEEARGKLAHTRLQELLKLGEELRVGGVGSNL